VTAVAGALLAAAVGAALWVSGGWVALLYALVFSAAVAPGIPLGIALFGAKHPAAWIGGALLGYGLTQLALWAAIETGVASIAGFLGAWATVVLLAAVVRRRVAVPAVSVSAWRPADVRALLLVLLLVPALMGITYRNLGREDADGNRYYRAYFTADFVWHCALAYELGKFSLPPKNPYLAPRVMNYYWTYFLLPASTARLAPSSAPDAQDIQRYLKANAILVGLLMLGTLLVLVRSATTSTFAASMAVLLSVVAASAEGSYAIVNLVQQGRPLSALTNINVDAVTGWPPFNGLRIDNIPRSLWYTPQHTASIALGLLALTVALNSGARARFAAIAGAGLALGLSATLNPLLGAACSAIYGVSVVFDAVATRGGVAVVARHTVAAAFLVAAMVWGWVSRVTEGAASAIDVGFDGFSRNSPLATLLLSLGPVLVPALGGVIRVRDALERRAVVMASTGIVLGLFLLYFVRISEASWVGFRAGQILLVSIPILLARALELLPLRVAAGLTVLVLLIGLPTNLVDTYNAQDIHNRRPGPGFRWTLWTTRDQEQAFAWIRANTDDHDIVQMEPIVRGREHWTLIPTFAGRGMAAGQPISLLPSPEYRARSEQVRTIFATPDPTEAAMVAKRFHIDYLYVDQADLAAYPEGTRKFDEHPSIFEKVFANSETRIYRVR
jgi:hypothetical protein